MITRLGTAVAAAVLVAGCLPAAELTTCDDGSVCASGHTCVASRCVADELLAACTPPRADRRCMFTGGEDGVCDADGVCAAPRWGDGVVSGIEACDDGTGNANTPDAACRLDCSARRCGDGIPDGDAGEACDDGNEVNGDGCTSTCAIEACGNGTVDIGEQCDDGNRVSGDGCQADCLAPRCGDGVIDLDLGEACDDGAANSTAPDAGCRPGCQPRRCGDGVVDVGPDLMAGTADDEVCDDGNLAFGDGCTPDCASDETCGNGFVDFFTNESCDDGNDRSRDSCDASCRLEPLVWAQVGVATGNRAGGALVFDPTRQRTVLVGGQTATDVLEWTGDAWATMPLAATSPPTMTTGTSTYDLGRRRVATMDGSSGMATFDGARVVTQVAPSPLPDITEGFALGYYPPTGQLIVFGGSNGILSTFDDITWAFDGVEWTPLDVFARPSARGFAAMAYDPVRRRLVLHGGYGEIDPTFGGAGVLDDTWEFDGTTWTQRTVGPPRYFAAMAWDAPTGKMILFGGRDHTMSRVAATAALTGTSWSALPGTQPAAREFPMMTYDARVGHIVLTGGITAGGPITDTWIWRDGWSQPSPLAPSKRRASPLAYDARRGVAVMFGGISGTAVTQQLHGDTWTWDGARWQQVQTGYPAPRSGHSLAYDAERGVVVMFGGASTAPLPPETYAWDGHEWLTFAGGTQPAARSEAAMAYDPVRREVVLFGGASIGFPTALFADVWRWDGATWTQATPATAPSARRRATMAADPSTGELVLFGGVDATGPRDDTWAWDGVTWRERATLTRPPRRGGATLVAGNARLLLFGGDGDGIRYDDTWELQGTRWVDVSRADRPPARTDAGLAYHAQTDRFVLWGGLAADDLGDTWIAALDDDQPAQVCGVAIDTDGDGLAGCDDDDCWSRCDPTCSLEARDRGVCAPATATAGYCGDGVCTRPVESCAMCPADCTLFCSLDGSCGNGVCEPGESAASCAVDCP
ncbi:MAG: hypothetical protein R2939_08270 [Kofleriaceae bacterium]